MTQVRMKPLDAGVRKWLRQCKILEWVEEGISMTSEEMPVRENVPWELRHVPQTECWIPGAVSFAVVIVPAAAVHNTLWKICDWKRDGRRGFLTHRTPCSVRRL